MLKKVLWSLRLLDFKHMISRFTLMKFWKRKRPLLQHIILVNLLPSIRVFHSLCEKVYFDYFLSGKGRPITSWRSHHLCVRKIVVFNLFVAARDITLCQLQEDVEMKSLIGITFDKKMKRLIEFWWLYLREYILQRWIGMF